MLKEIFGLQREIDKKAVAKAEELGEDVSTEALVNKRMLALYDEIGEVNREISYFWKYWKASKSFSRQRVKEELVDVLHFVFSLCLMFDISAEDIYYEYTKKNKENQKRAETNEY